MMNLPRLPADPRTVSSMPVSRSGARRLTPLMAALAAALPLALLAQTRPAPNVVPVPSASWRVQGSGSAAPVNTANGRGGVDQRIRQDSQRGIYQWQSFDIGASSSVTFDMTLPGGSALNRVMGSTAPSQIFGQLKATNGGEIYLINANGILFGRGAQVNTGSLVASALNLTDAEYLSGLTNNLLYSTRTPAFRYDGAPEDFIDSRNFVRVDEGASISTDNGGRVFLFAKRVDNAGQISTPGGQALLAGGGEIYLQTPSSQGALYASESNPDVPTLRGLLVEVGAGPAQAPNGAHGSVSNEATGVISSARGNTTLVGMAVNQLGRISATTSVTENGSIILRAQGNAQANNAGVAATQAGALVLGVNSQTQILPDDDAARNNGQPRTSDGNATFVEPHIEMAGASVLLDRGAQVLAPGAVVDVRASATPNRDAHATRSFQADADDAARIVLGDGAVIDVSGTTTAVASVDRYFVTTGLLGSNDLKDAPLQKDGLLYRSKATVDVRDDSNILGSLESYRDGLQQTIAERLSAGGQVRLSAGSGVLTHANSRIDVSGGQVSLTAADVRETQLIGANGQVVNLNTAAADQIYNGALNLQSGSGAGYDRWGVQVNYGGLTPTRREEGYVEGRAAGAVEIVAPTVLLQGSLSAATVSGSRQLSGEDAAAARGRLSIGAVRQGSNDFTAGTYTGGAVLRNFQISTLGPQPDGSLWDDAMNATLPAVSGLSRGTLTSAGFGEVAVAAVGDVSALPLSVNATLDLGDQARLRLLSGEGDVTLGGITRSAGGSVELNSKLGQAQLADGATVDLAGRFINSFQQGPLDTRASVGGSFSATGQAGVRLGEGSLVDVSGGAVVSSTGALSGAKAGSISLQHSALEVGDAPGLVMAGTLRGQSLGAGGSLSLTAPQIQIGSSASVTPEAGTLVLGTEWLREGGFGSFSVDGRRELLLAEGATLAPQRDEWQVDPRLALLAATGSRWQDIATPGPLPGVAPAAVSLSLKASGTQIDNGRLVMAEGARIEAPARSSISLSAQNELLLDGEIHSAGGSVSASLSARRPVTPGEASATTLWLGEHSRIDVSGTALITPSTNGLQQGQVLAGGSISLAARGAAETEPTLVIQQGAELIANGASATLDRSTLTNGGVRWVREQVSSNGGSIELEANRALVTEGQFGLHAGGDGASGGTLSVKLTAAPTANGNTPENALRELRLASGPTEKTGGLALGDTAGIADLNQTASISTAAINASGAANLVLASRDALRFLEGADLNLAGSLTLSSRALAVQPGQDSQLSAGQIRLQGERIDTGTSAPTPVVREGDASLSLNSRDGLLVSGNWVTQGVDQLQLSAQGDLMLQGLSATAPQGSLRTAADVAITARQVYPGTQASFTLQATGREVSISGQGGSAAGIEQPLSAGGTLRIEAAQITQGGVLRAPQGQILLQGSEGVSLSAGSETSVAATGLWLPYGSGNETRWFAPDGTVITSLPTKRIDLEAPSVQVAEGAELTLQGGGDLVAYEFVAGRGGSTDVFAGGNGAYALVPGIQGAAFYDASLAGAASLGRQIQIGEGAPVPAGTYTLMPARYALQPGAFLVEPVSATGSSSGPALALGTAVRQADGSVWVGARLGTAGTTLVDGQTSTWKISSASVSRQRSEIRETSANQLLTAQALRSGDALAERPLDAGSLSLATSSAQLAGHIDLSAAEEGGLGGRAEFSAEQIRLSANAASAASGEAAEGVLQLDAATLDATGARTVLLGARSGATGPQGTSLSVGAREIIVDTAGQTLALPDLVLAATERISVEAGSVLSTSAATANGAATSEAAPTAFVLRGDGAALRLSDAPGATLLRTGAELQTGSLSIGAGVQLNAAGGSLLLDATADTKLAGSSRISATEITLGAPTITIGGPVGGPGVLSLTPALTAQVSQADQVTLHAYRFINLKDGAVLGEDANGLPTLDRLVLDAPVLRATEATGAGARITAGEITLSNSAGSSAAPAQAGSGRVTLHSNAAAGGSGVMRQGDGRLLVQGAEQLQLDADNGLLLAGRQGSLAVAGDLTLNGRGLVAEVAGAGGGLSAGGTLHIAAAPEGTLVPASAAGASLSLSGARIQHDGRIVLPSGAVSLSAEDGLSLGAGSRLDVAGRQTAVGEATVEQAGGQVSLLARSGDVNLQGGVINVSGSGAAAGGRISLAAPEGAVQVQAQLRGSSSGPDGASLSIDSAAPVDLAALARQMDEADPNAFSGQIQLRQRQGDLTVGAATTLAAREIVLSADAGRLDVRGTLDARGDDGGRIALAAGQGLSLAAGAQLLASGQAADGEGGRVELSTTQGSLQLQAGSVVDLSAGEGASAPGGRLLLRAERLGISDALPGGAGVNIATLAGRISGAERIDVEAVKVYEGVNRVTDFAAPAPGTLLTSTLASDGAEFVGPNGGKATLLAERLAGGNAELLERLRIHAGAEIRSEGDLTVSLQGGTWRTPTERAEVTLGGGDARHVGDSSLTLRAAGDLNVGSSIDMGVHFSGLSTAGGSLRLTAGADLSAAASHAVQAAGSGDLTIASTQRRVNDLTVRTTTGDIQLAAAGDVNLAPQASSRTRLYSLGTPSDDPLVQAVRSEMFLFGGFGVGAGDIRIDAGNSVLGNASAGALASHPNQWMVFRESTSGISTWDAEPQRGTGFQQGVASFGGGRIDVQAAADVVKLVAATPGSGFVLADGTVQQQGGGSVHVTAGRDVVGGVLQAGGRDLSVTAGRDVAWGGQGDRPGLTLAHEDTAVRVQGRRDVTVGSSVSSHGLDGRWFSGLTPTASLGIQAAGGDLVYRADREQSTDNNPSSETRNLWPGQVLLAAPSGDVRLGAERAEGAIIQQAEGASTRLDLLAGANLTLRADLQVNARWTQGVAYHDAQGQDTNSLNGSGLPGSAWLALSYADLSRGDGASLDRSDRSPARFVAAGGDVELQGAIRSARPVRLLATGDVAMTGSNSTSGLEVQHQPERLDGSQPVGLSELSLIQAGRDISLGAAAVRVAGPGDLVALAGRDIDLGRGAGLQAVGNIDNATRLATGSAGLTLVAGLRADGADHAAAARRGFGALGAAALTSRAADLYALLSRADGEVPALGSSAAQAFRALGTDAQLAQVQALLGGPAYQAAVARYVRSIVGHADDSDAQALQAFAGLSDVKRAAASGVLLAEAFGRESAERRLPFIQQVAVADTPATAQALISFVQQHTGQRLALPEALAAFEALPLERQLLRLNAVLVDEVRSQGRSAVSARLAADKEAAYDRAYAAINSLFPVDRPDGDISLPATQVRSLQGSAITLLAPGGGVNAGETGSSGKSASQLGVVTVAGGDIAGIARDDILVNQSRIFTLAQGDILLWSSTADVDAGRGAKTVAGAPPPVYRLDSQGRIVVDTSGSFSGSGIAVLDANSALDLYAPAGAIDAGEAGIRALGTVVLGAEVVRGADDIQGGSVQGAPAASPTVGLTAGLSAATSNANSLNASGEDEDEKRKKRRARRNLLLEFLGFGRG